MRVPLLLVVVMGLACKPAVEKSRDTSVPMPTTSRSDADTVILRDTAWTTVDVEVRRGHDADCAKNAAFQTKNLALDEEWPIPAAGGAVCYRREKTPGGSPGVWSEWVLIPNPGQQTIYKNLK